MCTVCAQTSAQCVLYVLKHHLLRAGINVLIKIMAKMARKEEQSSVIDNYERLEFLGDAVVEFVTTVHLYFMLPDAPEGVLATYRTAIVQNQHLTELAKVRTYTERQWYDMYGCIVSALCILSQG